MVNIAAGYQIFTYDAPKICKGISAGRFTDFAGLKPGEYIVFHLWDAPGGAWEREDALIFINRGYGKYEILFQSIVNGVRVISEDLKDFYNGYPQLVNHVFWAAINEGKDVNGEWCTALYVRDQTTGIVYVNRSYPSYPNTEGSINAADIALEFWLDEYPLPESFNLHRFQEVYTNYHPCHGGDILTCAESCDYANFEWKEHVKPEIHNRHAEYFNGYNTELIQWKERK